MQVLSFLKNGKRYDITAEALEVLRKDMEGLTKDWDESKHPRDKGKFSSGGSGAGGGTTEGTPEISEITGAPKFKTTEEAMEYGRRNFDKPEKLKELAEGRKKLLEMTSELRAKGAEATDKELNRGMFLAVEAQLLREALEGAEEYRGHQ